MQTQDNMNSFGNMNIVGSIGNFINFAVVSTIVTFVLKTYISNIETQIDETLMFYGILSILSVIVVYLNDVQMNERSMKVVLEFHEKQVKKYSNMDKRSKEKSTIHVFSDKLERAERAIQSKYTWGASVMISVGSSLVGFCYIVIKHKQYKILFAFAFVHICWYFFITKGMMSKINIMRTTNREKRETLNDILSLLLIRIHSDQCSVSQYVPTYSKLEKMDTEQANYWLFVTSLQSLPNYIIMILIAYFVTNKLYLVLYIICNNLTGSIESALHFVNQYNTIQNDLKSLEEFWEGKTFDDKHTQKDIEHNISLYGCVNNFLVIEKPLTVIQGDRIIIDGGSGSGKTTLVKGLLGYLDGLTYSSGNHPLCYKNKIMYMYQNAIEYLPTVRTTIRQLFYDEEDDNLIFDALKTVQLVGWFDKVMRSNLDIMIEERISGGQKRRLCLAITVYQAKKYQVQWLILDEPDAALEDDLSQQMLVEVMNSFPNVTIFMILHMCKCRLEHLGINKKWYVENELVKQVDNDLEQQKALDIDWNLIDL